jgi:hypothetical protein
MTRRTNKPIFVIGSPRSGTSILTWCLGQHPNIIPLEESGWMGDLATHLGVFHLTGTARDQYSVLSSMDIQKTEFFNVFGRTVNDLILRHRLDLDRKSWRRAAGPNVPSECFVPHYESRTRWVDGTPEYSFHVCGLRKLFPEARFIHVFRDVTSVVRSMLHFHRVSGRRLVANEQQAYSYWLGAVRKCLLAEDAYGREIVFRLRHSDLVARPEAALRALFDFLGEPYAPECLQPLTQRINSSNVPPDFKHEDLATDPAIVQEARRLSIQLEQTPQANETFSIAIDELEAAFERGVQYVANWRPERLKLESAIRAYQAEQSKLESEYRELQLQLKAEQSRLESECRELQLQLKAEQSRLESECRELQLQLQEAATQSVQAEQRLAEVTTRLKRQVRDTRRLAQFLDQARGAAVQLRSSRRWKLANPGALIRAMLSGTTKIAGYGHLEKIFSAYSQWRASHSEIATMEERNSQFQSPQEATEDDKCRQSAQSVSGVAARRRS